MPSQPVQYMERTRRFYAAQGFERAYRWARFDEVPFAGLTKPLADSTVALITTAATYDRHASDPRAVVSEATDTAPERLYANDLSWDKRATHLDDLDSFFPIGPLQALAAEGRIGALAERFHCAPTDYSKRRTLETDGPEILRRCREDGADVALLVPI